jgi:hypothetical protein
MFKNLNPADLGTKCVISMFGTICREKVAEGTYFLVLIVHRDAQAVDTDTAGSTISLICCELSRSTIFRRFSREEFAIPNIELNAIAASISSIPNP